MLRNAKFLASALVMTAAAFGQDTVMTTCSTPQGASTAGGPVSAHVVFVASTDSLSVMLTDSQRNPMADTQLLSSLAFTLSTGQTTGTLQYSLAKSVVNVGGSGGTVTTLSTFQPTGWALAQNFNGGFELCVLCTALGAIGPSHLLIGPAGLSGTYDAANGSIAGNKPHNPFNYGYANFQISIPGLLPSSAITNAVFGFGTATGITVPAACTTTVIMHG